MKAPETGAFGLPVRAVPRSALEVRTVATVASIRLARQDRRPSIFVAMIPVALVAVAILAWHEVPWPRIP
jgi:hypothetical protein